MMRRLLTDDPDSEPLWLRLYLQPYGGHSAARLVGEDVPLPDPGAVTGLTVFGATPAEAGWRDPRAGLRLPGCRRAGARARQ